MTRTGPSRDARVGEGRGRLLNAKSFHRAARELMDLHEDGENGNPIVVMIVHAAIAYGDALTASSGGKVNQKDHAALPRLIRDALGQQADATQIARLQRILEEKDAASYGARTGRTEHARQLLEQLDRFGRWAEELIS